MQKRINGSIERVFFFFLSLHTYCAMIFLDVKDPVTKRTDESTALKEVTFDRQESTNKKANA